MKNFRFLVLAATLLLFFACGKDDDGTKVLDPTTLLTVQLGDNFLESADQTGYVFASKADGTLLDYKPLANNATITLETDDADVSDFTATLVVNRPDVIEGKGLRLTTYLEMPVGSTWWLDNHDFNGATTIASAKMLIEGTGDIAPSPFFVGGAGTGASINYSNNSMEATFDLYNNDPTLPALAIYKSSLDNQVRYFFDDALPVGQTTTVQHASLPVIASPTTIDLGNGQLNYFFLSGVVQSPSNDQASLSISEAFGSLTGQMQHYVPSGIFNKYFTYSGGQLPSTAHSFNSVVYSDVVEPSFTYPDFDFDVTPTANGFDFSTSSDFNSFSVVYKKDNDIYWTIHSPQKASLSFSFPTLPSDVQSAYPLLAQGVEYQNASGKRLDPPQPIADYYESIYPDQNSVISSQPLIRQDIITHQ